VGLDICGWFDNGSIASDMISPTDLLGIDSDNILKYLNLSLTINL